MGVFNAEGTDGQTALLVFNYKWLLCHAAVKTDILTQNNLKGTDKILFNY